jgi:hypothetical protein
MEQLLPCKLDYQKTLIMKAYFLPATLILALMFTSCVSTRAPFTQQLRDRYGISPEELKSIQFYISNDLVLTRGDREQKKETSDGELKLLKDEVVERIVIKAGTPCVIKEVVDGNRVTVSFETGSTRYLVFGSFKNKDGYYTLQALDWVKDRGKVNYGEKMYMTSPGSRDIFLVLKVKSLDKFRVDEKVVKGQTVK